MSSAAIDSFLSAPTLSGAHREYQVLNQRLTEAAVRQMANLCRSAASLMSNSVWTLVVREPEWKKLSLSSTRVPRAENSVHQSHMVSILRTSSVLDAKMYIS